MKPAITFDALRMNVKGLKVKLVVLVMAGVEFLPFELSSTGETGCVASPIHRRQRSPNELLVIEGGGIHSGHIRR